MQRGKRGTGAVVGVAPGRSQHGTSPHSLNFCCSSPPSKTAAFEQFKEECGSEINRIFKENKSILLARKKRSSTVARRINFIKQEMEDIKKALEAQRQERWQQGKSLATQ